MTEFVLMMTRDDVTVPDALQLYEEISDTGISHIGFKDMGIDISDQAELVRTIGDNDHASFLEVVDLTEEGEVKSATNAAQIGVDYLVGGTRIETTLELIKGTRVKYMPYVGDPVGHPATLTGEIDDIADQAKRAADLGVHGINLLAFRYRGNPLELTERVVESVDIPVLAAGSVNSFERIRQLRDAGVWGFTIGGAVMDSSMVNGGIAEQIRAVLDTLGSNPDVSGTNQQTDGRSV